MDRGSTFYTKNGINVLINFPKALSFREVQLRTVEIASLYPVDSISIVKDIVFDVYAKSYSQGSKSDKIILPIDNILSIAQIEKISVPTT